jgi:hypothetical protein
MYPANYWHVAALHAGISSRRFRTKLCSALCMSLAVIAWAANSVYGQNVSIYSSIVGVARDASGGVVPGAKITATNVSTEISKSANTNNAGEYRIDGLTAGTYRVSAEHLGFQRFVKEDVLLTSSTTVRADAILQVGSVAQTVTVTAAVPLINTESGQIASTLGWSDRRFLPTIMPSFFTTLALNPGVVSSYPSYNVSFEGSTTTNQDFNVNGSTFRSPFSGHAAFIGHFDEWQQEVTVGDVNNSAEYPTMASVTATSKSGTNQWHGSGVEYYKSGALQSRNPFYPAHIGGVLNQWAGSLGGPIKRDKAFFYTAYSGSRLHGPVTILATVPTPAMRIGDFSAFSSTPVKDPTTGQPFQGNAIPSNRISSVSTAFINRFYPMPNYGDPSVYAGNNYRNVVPQMPADDQAFGRVDYQISARHSLFVDYMFDEGNRGGLFTGAFPNVGLRRGYRRDQNTAFSDLYSFGPNLYNQLNVGWGRDGNYIFGSTFGPDVEKLLGLQGIYPLAFPAIPTMSISGETTVSQQSYNTIRENNFTAHDDVAYMRGRHQLKFGVLYSHGSSATPAFTTDNFYGSFSFDGFATGGAGNVANSLADFLLGIPHSSSRQNGSFFNNLYRLDHKLEFYGQDIFQVTPKLTLTLGLRYEYHQPWREKHGLYGTFDPQTQTIIVQDEQSLKAVNPLLSPLFQFKTAQQAGYPSRLVNFSELNLAPRVSLAYRLTPTLVVRSAYGIFYDYNPPYIGNLSPFTPSETFPSNTIVNGIPSYQFPNPFPATPISGVGVGSLSESGYVRNLQYPYVQQWNLTVEKQFLADTGLRVSYIANHSVDAPYSRNINLPLPSTTTFTQSRRPLPLFGSVSILDQGGNSSYQALEAQVKHRGKGGLSLSSSFNWVKLLADVGLSPGGSTLNPFNRALDYGNVTWQSRFRSVTTLTWLVPVGPGRRYGSNWRGPLKWVLGDWQTGNILTAASGDFLTPSYSGYDASGLAITSGRPDQIGDWHVSNPTMAQWFNPAAFAIPGAAPGTPLKAPAAPIGRFGTAGLGILTGPGWWQDDWSLTKKVPITERVSLHLFLFATNVFNHINPADPNLGITVPQTVGQIQSIRSDIGNGFGGGSAAGSVVTVAESSGSGIGPRAFQLGARIEF